MNTFNYYYKHFKKFENKIISWNPDYIVPVAKKGCKLLKASNRFEGKYSSLIRYRTYFELNNVSVKGKKISIVDDATQFTSTLQEYRAFFENLGAEVRTFSFVGHENLYEGKKWRYDEKAEIEYFLPDPVYHEYILQQSYFLLENGNQYDLDHLVFEVDLSKIYFELFLTKLKTLGLLLHLEDYFLMQKTKRFSLINPSFFNNLPFFSDESVSIGAILKIKFIYNPDTEKLYFSPLVFPIWDYKNTKLKKTSFNKIPFYLPFDMPSTYDIKNESTLLCIYHNILFTYIGGFAKAFFQQLSSFNLCSSMKVKKNDLNALLGIEETAKFIGSLEKYVCSSEKVGFVEEIISQEQTLSTRNQFKSFEDVLDYLKNNYEKRCKKEKSRIGIHYYIPYEKLFNRFKDKISLSENLDYYCDFGVIVPETRFENGKIQRVCRTGEPDSDYNWKRTQILIPLVIQQYIKEFDKKFIEPMLLNKLLANFTYDYPSEIHHELHCLIGEPYTFGTLVKAYHHHRASRKPSIYSYRAISPYYHWDKDKNIFSIVNLPEITKKIIYLFDERQEISYSEIITYFKMLLKIYKHFKNVDILNMLSICREENYFYSHVLYNINIWIENYGSFLDSLDLKDKIDFLHNAGTQANSSWDKIKLAEIIKIKLDEIDKNFSTDLEILKALEKVKKNYIPFSNKFHETFTRLKQIVELELILTTLSLYQYTHDKKYESQLNKHEAKKILEKHKLTIPDNFNFKSTNDFSIIANRIFIGIKKYFDSLPSEEPLLYAQLKNQMHQRARNIATSYVYKENLNEATILYLDFSGLRAIPEPKEDIIAEYYLITERKARKRNGIKLNGGRDGDDAYSFLFYSIDQAIQCAKDIKLEFNNNLFFTSYDIKFGICVTKLTDDKKEEGIIKCWGIAKDCCEYKGVSFRNKGHLLVSQETIDVLKSNEYSHINEFTKIDGEGLKNDTSSSVYKFTHINPIQ